MGFPIANKFEIATLAEEFGVDFMLLMNDKERWDYVESRSGAQLINEVMELIRKLQGFRSVVFLGSDMRIRLVKSILRCQVVAIELGKSPLRGDREVDTGRLRAIFQELRDAKSLVAD